MRYFSVVRTLEFHGVIFSAMLALGGCCMSAQAQATAAKDSPPPLPLRTLGELKLNLNTDVHNGTVAYVDAHTVTMESGQFIHVVVSKNNMEFTVALLDPQGKTVLSGGNPDAGGPEYLSWIADKRGQYTIHVTPPTLAFGKLIEDYSIELKELREAQADDPLRVQALIDTYKLMSPERALNEQELAAQEPAALALSADWEHLGDPYQRCLLLRLFHSYKPRLAPTDTVLRNDIGACLARELSDVDRAGDLFLSAADAGDAASQYNLGLLYERFHTADLRYLGLAYDSYVKAAAQHLPEAYYSLGLLYERGRGIKQNATIALSLYDKAATLGYAPAEERVGVFYRFGGIGGVPANAQISTAMLTSAAEQGYGPAEYELGGVYETGTPPDLASAKLWYEKALGRGIEQAQSGLARVSELELGLPGQPRAADEMTYARNLADVEQWDSRAYKNEPLVAAAPGETNVAKAAPPANAPVITPEIPLSPLNPSISSGPNFALVIGIQNYTVLHRLKTSLADADAIAAELKDHYGFQIKVLRDSTRYQIETALAEYRRTLPVNANLLIYYAGHGYYDSETDKAYWLPVDAERDSHANWIIADEITSEARAMAANHVLVISDSCFSGKLNRAASTSMQPTARTAYINKMIVPRSRTLMSSGGNEPVADDDGNGHSVFADALLAGLKQIDHNKFSARELFEDYVQPKVGGHSDQLPQYDALRNSGDDFGDFIFVKAPLKAK
jgi:uncharacterized caspase-like protein